jgi:hypothetical protein
MEMNLQRTFACTPPEAGHDEVGQGGHIVVSDISQVKEVDLMQPIDQEAPQSCFAFSLVILTSFCGALHILHSIGKIFNFRP